jgi:hypothetical protein
LGLFRRRRESLNEQLLRDAGLDPAQLLGDSRPRPLLQPPSILAAAGVPDGSSLGPKEWDAAVTVEAPGLTGDRVEFTTLPNGDLIVSDESGDADLSPLADAVEQHVSPPYRAVAARQDGDLWGVGAKRIAVESFPFPDAEAVELTRKDSWTELRVDGEPSDRAVPRALEQLGERAGPDYFVKGERIDGDSWEVKVSAL